MKEEFLGWKVGGKLGRTISGEKEHLKMAYDLEIFKGE